MREALATTLCLTLLTGLAPAAAADLSLEREAELERLVLQDCGSCHGLTLKGGLGPDIRAETLADIPPEALTEIVLDGIPGTAMPPWRPLLSEDDARWIADFLLKGDVE